MFKVNNRNTKTRCEICSKLTIKIPERLVSLLLTLNIHFTPCSSVSIDNFEQVNAGWAAEMRVIRNPSKANDTVWKETTDTILCCLLDSP